MYHQHRGNNKHLNLRTTCTSESHAVLLHGDATSEMGLVLSTDVKPRLKWTPELHQRFIEAVTQLGGAEKATPKTVMRLMGIQGLTLYHLKSHLQKYRLSKNIQAKAYNRTAYKAGGCATASDISEEKSSSMLCSINIVPKEEKTLQMTNALQMQMEVQRQLNEQLEVQRHLQLRIEAQGKYLQTVLEKAHETLGNQNLGASELDTKTIYPNQDSRVKDEHDSSEFKILEGNSSIRKLGTQQTEFSPISSCLTVSNEFIEWQKAHQWERVESYDYATSFLTHRNIRKQHPSPEGLDKQKTVLVTNFDGKKKSHATEESNYNDLSMNDPRVVDDTATRSCPKSGKDNELAFTSYNKELDYRAEKHSREKEDFEDSFWGTRIDLNIHGSDHDDQGSKHFDLNGFNWN